MKSLMKSATESSTGNSVGRFIYQGNRPRISPDKIVLTTESSELTSEVISNRLSLIRIIDEGITDYSKKMVGGGRNGPRLSEEGGIDADDFKVHYGPGGKILLQLDKYADTFFYDDFNLQTNLNLKELGFNNPEEFEAWLTNSLERSGVKSTVRSELAAAAAKVEEVPTGGGRGDGAAEVTTRRQAAESAETKAPYIKKDLDTDVKALNKDSTLQDVLDIFQKWGGLNQGLIVPGAKIGDHNIDTYQGLSDYAALLVKKADQEKAAEAAGEAPQALVETAPEAVPTLGTLKITASALNVRQTPNGVKSGQFKKGELVTIVEAEKEGWVKVKSVSGLEGYVSAKYTEAAAEAVEEAPAGGGDGVAEAVLEESATDELDFSAAREALNTLTGADLQGKINDLAAELGIVFTGGGTIDGKLKVDGQVGGGTRRAKAKVEAEMIKLESMITPTTLDLLRESGMLVTAGETNFETDAGKTVEAKFFDHIQQYMQNQFGVIVAYHEIMLIDPKTGETFMVPDGPYDKRRQTITRQNGKVVSRGPVTTQRTGEGRQLDGLAARFASGELVGTLRNTPNARKGEGISPMERIDISRDNRIEESEVLKGSKTVEVKYPTTDTIKEVISQLLRQPKIAAFFAAKGINTSDHMAVAPYLYQEVSGTRIPMGDNFLIRCGTKIGVSEVEHTLSPDPKVHYNGQPCGGSVLCPAFVDLPYVPTVKPHVVTDVPPEEENPVEQCCFPAGTKVSMADGSKKNIEDVVVGEMVVSYDEAASENKIAEVKEVETPVREGLYHLNKNLLRVTDEHPIYVEKSDGTVGWASFNPGKALEHHGFESMNLEIGDKIQLEDGSRIELETAEFETGEVQTYNLSSVDQFNTFYADGVLVHNKDCSGCSGVSVDSTGTEGTSGTVSF